MVTSFLSDLTGPQVPDYSAEEAMCGHSCHPSTLLLPLFMSNPRQKGFSWTHTNIFIFRQCLHVAQLASNSASFCLHLPQIQCEDYMYALPHSTCFTDLFLDRCYIDCVLTALLSATESLIHVLLFSIDLRGHTVIWLSSMKYSFSLFLLV